jgi:predicted transcriptional regulator
MMRTTIMTEKLVRRGVRVAGEYDVDPLAHVIVGELATRELRVLHADATVADSISQIKDRPERHQAYPVPLGDRLQGVVTMRELLGSSGHVLVGQLVARAPVVARPSETARAVIMRMAAEDVGRIVMVDEDDPQRAIGIITRSDLITALANNARTEPTGPEGLA